jgi:hypothetical protein
VINCSLYVTVQSCNQPAEWFPFLVYFFRDDTVSLKDPTGYFLSYIETDRYIKCQTGYIRMAHRRE